MRIATVQVNSGDREGSRTVGSSSSGRSKTSSNVVALGVSPTIVQMVRVCPGPKKMPNLVALLKSILRREVDLRQPNAVLVFCNHIKSVRKTCADLQDLGVRCGQLHGKVCRRAHPSCWQLLPATVSSLPHRTEAVCVRCRCCAVDTTAGPEEARESRGRLQGRRGARLARYGRGRARAPH